MTTKQNLGDWPDDARPGFPQDPERTRPHELWNLPHNGGLGPTFWTWDADGQFWTLGFYMKHPEGAAAAWRYVGPCLTPAEVAARVAEAKADGMREAAGIAAQVRQRANECAREPDLIANIRREYLAQARGAEDVEEAILAAIEKTEPPHDR